MQRVKTLLRERNERGHTEEHLLAATQSQGVVLKEKYDNRTVLPANEVDQFKLVKEGDFVISLRSFQGGIEYAYDQGIISPAYTVIYPYNPLNNDYFTRLFKSRPFVQSLAICVTGIREGQNVDYARLQIQTIPVPPLDEQRAIARFLDQADEQIQRYIASKERLIALLEEGMQALVHQAVTRGLDPSVRLRPSRVEWLGEVPEHWEDARFGQNISIAEGQVDPKIEPYSSMLMIAPNHVESGTGRLLKRETAYEQEAISGKYFCRAGDVVYSKIRPGLAKVTVAPSDCLCSADMYPLRPGNPLQSDFLLWLLLSTGFTAWSVLESGRVAMPKMNRQTLNNVHIPLPPLAEQASIVQHLVEATVKASNAINRSRRQVDLMNEYRTRLIADVVTGQLDVSEAAAHLQTAPLETKLSDEIVMNQEASER